MHNAPSVIYPVGRSLFSGALYLSCWLLGVVAACLWWGSMADPGWRGWVIACAAIATGALAAFSWWHSAKGELEWNGESWSWTQQRKTYEGRIVSRLDLQKWMLAHWQAAGQTRWLWLERSSAPAHWDDLRRAVYSRARPQPRPEAMPATGRP